MNEIKFNEFNVSFTVKVTYTVDVFKERLNAMFEHGILNYMDGIMQFPENVIVVSKVLEEEK